MRTNETVRVGVMPGRIQEIAVEGTTTIAEVLSFAGLDASGYDVKVNDNKVTDLSTPIGDASMVLLVKQVKGNRKEI